MTLPSATSKAEDIEVPEVQVSTQKYINYKTEILK